MGRERGARRGGFTLLEVVLAIALVLMLTAAVGSFVWNLLDRRATMIGVGRDVHAAGALIDRIEGDLLAAIAGDETAGAGVDGTGVSLRLLTRGVWIDVGGGAGGGSGGGDLQRCEYRFDAAGVRVTAARGPAGGGAGAGDGGGAGGAELVSDRVERVRFRYFDGREWVDSFNSLEKGDLPVAVEVAVWMAAAGVGPRLPEGAGAAVEDAGGIGGLGRETNEELRRAGASEEFELPLAEMQGERRWGEPDRLRVIVVPDGPVTAWRDRS